MRFRIFISSVQDEFREERRELKQWILQNPLLSRYVESVFLFEDSPARGDGSQEVFLEEVARSQIYIGILGRRYCGRDHGDCEVSPTELEYDKAGECGLERFVYLLDCAERDERQSAFVRKVNADVKRRSLGSGVRRMVNSCRKANVPNPAFEQAGPSFRVTFWFDQWTDSRLAQLKLNERQRMAVRFLKENALITEAQYAEMGTVVKRTAIRDLRELVEKDVIETVGVGKSISYALKHLRDICATCATQSRQDCAIGNSTVSKVAKLSVNHVIVEDNIEDELVSGGEKLVDGEKKLVYDGEKLVYDGEKLVYDGEKLVFDNFSRPTLEQIAMIYQLLGESIFSVTDIVSRCHMPRSSAIRLLAKMKSAMMISSAAGRGKYRFAVEQLVKRGN